MTEQLGPVGRYYVMQPHWGMGQKMLFLPQGNGTTVTTIGYSNTSTGATTRNVATTNLLTSLRRIGYVSSSATSSSAGTRHNAQVFWLGNATNLGGFHFICRFATTTTSTQRAFVGMVGTTSALSATSDPSSNYNLLGFGYDSADTAWSFMHSNGITVPATKDALTGTFPQGNGTDVFEVRIYAPPNASIVYYSIEDLTSGAYFENSASSAIPGSSTFLAPQIWVNTGPTSSTAVAVDVISLYVETDF